MTYQEANAFVDDFSFVYKGKSIPKEALIECREVIHKACEKQIPRKEYLTREPHTILKQAIVSTAVLTANILSLIVTSISTQLINALVADIQYWTEHQITVGTADRL